MTLGFRVLGVGVCRIYGLGFWGFGFTGFRF